MLVDERKRVGSRGSPFNCSSSSQRLPPASNIVRSTQFPSFSRPNITPPILSNLLVVPRVSSSPSSASSNPISEPRSHSGAQSLNNCPTRPQFHQKVQLLLAEASISPRQSTKKLESLSSSKSPFLLRNAWILASPVHLTKASGGDSHVHPLLNQVPSVQMSRTKDVYACLFDVI